MYESADVMMLNVQYVVDVDDVDDVVDGLGCRNASDVG
jgi:hypothetical protein